MTTKAEFIAFFSKIPDEKWLAKASNEFEAFHGRGCALNHMGRAKFLSGAHKLIRQFENSLDTTLPAVNDARDLRYQQSTPKARILAALNDLPDEKI